MAILIRSDEEFKKKRELQRVRLMLRNRGVHIRLLVFSQNSYRAALRFRRRLNWLGRRREHVVRVSRVRRAKYDKGDSFREKERGRTGRWMVGAVLFWLLIAIFYYYFIPLLRWDVFLDSGKTYQPRDAERDPKSRPKAQPNQRKGARSAPEGAPSDIFYE
ncbi:MAG: hypothetical protein O2807_14380 [bacterium]|nr:hypothetical protein [bacterium]